nr:unnamed protein product [Callosobruchus analis]
MAGVMVTFRYVVSDIGMSIRKLQVLFVLLISLASLGKLHLFDFCGICPEEDSNIEPAYYPPGNSIEEINRHYFKSKSSVFTNKNMIAHDSLKLAMKS